MCLYVCVGGWVCPPSQTVRWKAAVVWLTSCCLNALRRSLMAIGAACGSRTWMETLHRKRWKERALVTGECHKRRHPEVQMNMKVLYSLIISHLWVFPLKIPEMHHYYLVIGIKTCFKRTLHATSAQFSWHKPLLNLAWAVFLYGNSRWIYRARLPPCFLE